MIRAYMIYCTVLIASVAAAGYYGFIPFDAQSFATRADRSAQHFHK